MPTVLNVNALLVAYKSDFDVVEDNILKKLKVYREKGIESKREVKRRLAHAGDRCTFDRTLSMNVGSWVVPHGSCLASVWRCDPEGSVMCTPVMTFQTTQQLTDLLRNVECELVQKLLLQKPRRVGSLHVYCVVNPNRLCFELTMAIPFSKEE